MKKIIISILIVLLMVSIYKDLTAGTNFSNINQKENKQPFHSNISQQFSPIKVKIEQGDTLITIIERLNPSLNELNMDQIVEDFRYLNPTVDPNQLQINRFYFFPQY
ncbi:hypothetical protein [Ornithinibacillus scapharcae]|uniref:hypothetical protein n=1 Tax=Ornithinibacillus scapharcae TaxID=1147159 RepID=UPI000225B390|nr:hypothetical protein [Ornithinibacillus scapharcae]